HHAFPVKLVLLHFPCDPRHLRDQRNHAHPVGPQRQIDAGQDILQLYPISLKECAVEQSPRYLEANRAMIGIGSITAAANLYHVKAKLSLDMNSGIVLVANVIAILSAELGIEHRDRLVDRNSMAGAVSRIM